MQLLISLVFIITNHHHHHNHHYYTILINALSQQKKTRAYKKFDKKKCRKIAIHQPPTTPPEGFKASIREKSINQSLDFYYDFWTNNQASKQAKIPRNVTSTLQKSFITRNEKNVIEKRKEKKVIIYMSSRVCAYNENGRIHKQWCK